MRFRKHSTRIEFKLRAVFSFHFPLLPIFGAFVFFFLVGLLTMALGSRPRNRSIREIVEYLGHRTAEKGFPCCRISDDATTCSDDMCVSHVTSRK